MEPPNYFLADLEDHSLLTPSLIREACQTLKRNRAQFLSRWTSEGLINLLARLAKDWLDPDFPFRKTALELGPARTGFSRATLAAGLDVFFRRITRENLWALLVQDLGSPRQLDEWVMDSAGSSGPRGAAGARGALAHGPELIAHIGGGLLPNPALTSLMLGLLARSAQFLKCASRTSFLPRLFAHSLYAVQPKLAACLEIAEWPGGTLPLEEALLAEADCVTVTGSDETLTRLRRQLPGTTRFLGYGYRASVALVTREMLAGPALQNSAPAAARDVAAWDQLGCLSPQAIYVEAGGAVGPEVFAAKLAEELAALELLQPRGQVAVEIAAAITTRRMVYQVRAANDDSCRIWCSPGSTAWTVIYEADPEFRPSCLHRFIHVKPFAEAGDLVRALAPLHGRLSTLGLAATSQRAREIADSLSPIGVSRVCALGTMQDPPLLWRHDGRPSLGDLVSWTDLEL